MQLSFYIKEHRLDELKIFIRKITPSVRLNYNPIKVNYKLHISLTLDVVDCNKINELLNRWHDEDNCIKLNKSSYFKRIMNIFK